VSDTLRPFLLSVVMADGETATSDHDTQREAHDTGQWLVNARECTAYVVEATQQNALSMPVILEVWP
jgi:hypothetical protein